MAMGVGSLPVGRGLGGAGDRGPFSRRRRLCANNSLAVASRQYSLFFVIAGRPLSVHLLWFHAVSPGFRRMLNVHFSSKRYSSTDRWHSRPLCDEDLSPHDICVLRSA